IYYPLDAGDVPVIIWFHGGGLTGGEKEIPEALKEKGYCIVGVGYRLSPQVKAEVSVLDAAAAVAWVFKNINRYNGNTKQIFVSGHSAGGYLALMTVMDKSKLKKYDIDANTVAGLAPFSGHTITHFTIRAERGIPGEQPIVDKWAPLYYVRGDAPPTLLITGDREMEMLGRYEENAYFYRMMKVAGQKDITQYEMQGYGHNMTYPAFPLLLNFVADKTKSDD
ncbi:MAG: alpha/beta hydrolase, partial [Leeuwenhoekiella sp.]